MDPLAAKLIYLLGYWLANFVIRAPYLKAHHRQPVRIHRKTRVDIALLLAVSIGGFLVPLVYVFTSVLAFADYTSPLWLGLAGTATLILGDWLFWRAHKDLGSQWSPTLEIREGHQLVTHGIYRRIRHPMYASLWLLVLAQAMILPNWIAGFSGLAPFAVLYFHRVGREEQLMREQFGPQYEQYLRTTGRLIPKF